MSQQIIPYHVYPVNDLREHMLLDLYCWCNPVYDLDTDIVVHDALDGRDIIAKSLIN